MREPSDQLKFHFSDIGLPLRIGAVAILAVFAVVGVGSTARYAASLPKPTPSNSSQNNNSSQNTAPVNNSQNNPTINQPQSGSGSGGNGSASRCTAAARSALTQQYNSQTATENARHQNVINFLTATNAPASAFAAENSTHSANLGSINSQYQNNLRSIGC